MCDFRKAGFPLRTKAHLTLVESTKVACVRAHDRTSLYDSKGVAGANRTSRFRNRTERCVRSGSGGFTPPMAAALKAAATKSFL